MIDVNALKGEIARNGYTQEQFAAVLGISPRTLTNRLAKKEFGSREISIMIKTLNIKEPMEIFFAEKVT